jgi:hypothetical protein
MAIYRSKRRTRMVISFKTNNYEGAELQKAYSDLEEVHILISEY